MKKQIGFDEVGLELVEMPAMNVRQVMENNEEAIQALSAFAQPIKVELVQPPTRVQTVINFEVYEEPTQDEIRAAKRSKTAHTVTLFDLVALASVSGMAVAKLGVLDLVSFWT